MYNQTRDEYVKAMIVKHKNDPAPLKIVSTDIYLKSDVRVSKTKVVVDPQTGQHKTVIVYEFEPGNFRKIIGLSDGSFWVIKDKLNDFSLGTCVYIGAQGSATNYYDFVFIAGVQREAVWTYARPQK